MVIHAVDYSRKDGVFATSELNFFLGKNFLVTYHDVPLRSIQGHGGTLSEKHRARRAGAGPGGAHAAGWHRGELQTGAGELSLEIAELEEQVVQIRQGNA